MPVVESNLELSLLLERWDKEFRSNSNPPLEILQRISELVEKETEAYFKTDPDPFDDRHPIRTRPDSALGVLLKNLFRDDEFITRLVNSYLLSRDNVELQTLSCRLLYVLLPGMESSAVFNETEHIVSRLYQWAQTAGEPLRSYATGLLATAMTIPEVATLFKDDNMRLVPIMLRRLKELSCIQDAQLGTSSPAEAAAQTSTQPQDLPGQPPSPTRAGLPASSPSANGAAAPSEDSPLTFQGIRGDEPQPTAAVEDSAAGHRSDRKRELSDSQLDDSSPLEQASKRRRDLSFVGSFIGGSYSSMSSNGPHSNRRLLSPPHLTSECSNSSWAELEPYMIGTFRMFPLSVEMQQRFILQYLTPMGDYQELLCHVFENDAQRLICHYIDLKKNSDIRLSFDALRYLASLLCHKKFALEFLRMGGLEVLLKVYRPSVAATGVSLCLYYLAYNEDAMEHICLQPKPVLIELVNYALWLLECSHGSSRCHSTNFFSVSFAFRNILELFDAQDGLRKLLNVMFMLDLFSDDAALSDDELLLKQQTARHVCVSLRKYFETHLLIECEQLRRSSIAKHLNHGQPSATHIVQCINKLNVGNIPANKQIRYPPEAIVEFIEALLELMPLRKSWKPVEDLIKLGGLKMLLNLVYVSTDWSFSGKPECVKCALDVLVVGSALPKLQTALVEELTLDQIDSTTCKTTGIHVILEAADGLVAIDPDVQCSALQVLINCCCAPLQRIGSSSIRLFQTPSATQASSANAPTTPTASQTTPQSTQSKLAMAPPSSSKRSRSSKHGEDLLHRMWDSVRSSNGILILLNLLSVKVPITHADKLRSLACKALCGLARNEKIKQILGKLPVFTTGELQQLMKEPIVQERRLEHLQFTRRCITLIERVTGTPIHRQLESASPAYLSRAEVVAQTQITYNQKELMQLIHSHLDQQGFSKTAKLLLEEASLVSGSQSNALTWPSNTPPSNASFSSARKRFNKRRPYLINDCTSSPTGSTVRVLSQKEKLEKQADKLEKPLEKLVNGSLERCDSPARFRSNSINGHPLACAIGSKSTVQMHSGITPVRSSSFTPLRHPSLAAPADKTGGITLDNIVTEYLRKQHSLCTHPVYTCPPFDLFKPHRCPAPNSRSLAPQNCVRRLAQRQIQPRFGGPNGPKHDRQLVYSKFRPIRTFRETEGASSVTSCAFSFVQQFLFLGTFSGDLVLYNLNTCTLEASYQCHHSDITNVEPSKDGKLVLTCSQWRRPVSSLWTFTDIFELKMNFGEDPYAEFAKQTQDRALGTRRTAAHLYDLETGVRIQTFNDERLSNGYKKNKATFNYTDDLVLNDGVLWDVRSSAHVHKYDKFNRDLNGVFHPNGWQIVANSEVWDLRTHRLLCNVPALDQCHIQFNQTGDVIYGAMFEEETPMSDDVQSRSPFCSSIRTFDAHDYSNITAFDTKRVIYDLSVDQSDSFLAVVENIHLNSQGVLSSESICKLYEIGRCKEDGEDDDDEEEDDENMEDDDDEEDDEEDDDDEDLDDSDDDHHMSDFAHFVSGNSSNGSEGTIYGHSSGDEVVGAGDDDDDDDDDEDDDDDDDGEDDEDEDDEDDEDDDLNYELLELGADPPEASGDEGDASWDPSM